MIRLVVLACLVLAQVQLAIQSDRDGTMRIYIIDLQGRTLAAVAP